MGKQHDTIPNEPQEAPGNEPQEVPQQPDQGGSQLNQTEV